MANKLVLYAESTFDVANPNSSQKQAMRAAAKTIRQSGFTDLILAFLHVTPAGALVYNDTQLGDLDPDLPALLAGIKSGGTVKRLLVSVGGGGGVSDSDYSHIKANPSAFQTSLAAFMTRYRIDGVDFDLEAENTPYSAYTQLLIYLTGWLSGHGKLVAMPPYKKQGFWIKVLEGTNGKGGQQVSWLDLQIYGGADYAAWEAALAASPIGIGDLPGFLYPGYNAAYSTPNQVGSEVQGLKRRYPTLDGAMMWKFESMGGNPAAYAQALAKGLR